MISGIGDEDLCILGEGLLEFPGFWAAFLGWLAEGEDYEPGPDAFGVDGADADAAYEQLTDPSSWPVIHVPLQHGHFVSIVHRNFVEDEGVDYYLAHPDWARPAPLASIEGHYSGPGLAWSELVHIAGHPGEGRGVRDPNARLLLLLPILGDSAMPADAEVAVSTALAAIGAPPSMRTALARALLDHPFWTGETWYLQDPGPPSPGDSADGSSQIMICRGRHSPRAIPFQLSAVHAASLAEALGSAAS